MKNIIILSISCLILTSCAAPNYLSGYSESLYSYRRDANESSTNAHVKFLERKIASAEERKRTIPPGLCFELGYFYEISGQGAKAKAMFEKEMALYPESSVFISRLLARSQNVKQ